MLGIAFAGCACRVAFHAGVAAGLDEAGVPIALASGASSGSIAAAAVAAGRARELPSVFRALAGRSIVSLERALWNRSPFDMSHLVRTTLVAHLGEIDLRDRPVEALVVATRLRDLRPMIYSSRDEPSLLEPVLGSCFLPVLYGRTVRVRGELLVDGGLVDNLPLAPLRERGADEILAVVPSPDGLAMKHPLRRRFRPAIAGARVHVLHPRAPLALRSWDFDKGRVERALDEGYAVARAFTGN